MCLATPMELIRIDGEYGYVEHAGNEYKVDLSLIDSPMMGDWILAHGELAVSRIPSKDAQEILQLISQTEPSH